MASKFVIVTTYENETFYFTKNSSWSPRLEDAKFYCSQSSAMKGMSEDIPYKKMLGLPKVGRREEPK